MPFSKSIRQASLSLAFFLLVSGSATAGTLFGTVSEIHDGDTITIICLKRPLMVHLAGTVAPEKEQPYSEVARQHLSDLILNKEVVVESSGLGENMLIVGRVFLKESDVGAQMLRDGAAWYDKPYDTILTEEQRQLYSACEQAARSERRGIWQDQNPLPPWEFKAGLRLPEPSKLSPVNSQSPKIKNGGLTNESLSPSFATTGPLSLGSSEAVTISSDSRWLRFTPPESKVSMLVPGYGTRQTSKVLLEEPLR
jgi:endonuclease YncB( thermonuclease family)